ncbi:MAG: Zn-dependent exopeptidase M28 [Acidobacteriia bacterium]|nr:Zn-dependent exopeptidase M28 [Terriglobia bacterium]
MRAIKSALPIYILLAAASHGVAQQTNDSPFQYSLAPKKVVQDRLGAYARKNAEREPAVRRLFEEAGCTGDALTEQTVKGAKAPNVLCTLGSTTDSIIVVGAHFDLVEAGNGVVDNWTGAALLSSLYQGLAATPRLHTYVFVAFSGEETGLHGSLGFVKQLGDRRQRVRAMVNLDSLGLSETKVWTSHADQNLVGLLGGVAKALDLPVAGMNVDNVGTSDSEPFRQQKIPAITVHSVTQETLKILHSKADTIEAVHLDEYYRTYRLLAAYLAVLDQKLE